MSHSWREEFRIEIQLNVCLSSLKSGSQHFASALPDFSGCKKPEKSHHGTEKAIFLKMSPTPIFFICHRILRPQFLGENVLVSIILDSSKKVHFANFSEDLVVSKTCFPYLREENSTKMSLIFSKLICLEENSYMYRSFPNFCTIAEKCSFLGAPTDNFFANWSKDSLRHS